MAAITRDEVYNLLSQVKDPEIPVLSLVDLGVITDVQVENERVTVELTPTFVGCPALEGMQSEIRTLMQSHGINDISVVVSYRQPWTSDRISEKGKDVLKKFGLAPPPPRELFTDLTILEHAECPRCGGTDTELRNPFGSTLCRSIHYCYVCRESFEQFKPL